jgi:ADP-heptose:LPS heptosyltransferase
MKISVLKFLDETFGPLACFFFCMYNSIKRLVVKENSIDSLKVNNILIIKFFGIGSIMLSGPMMRALRSRFPASKILLLTFSSNYDMCSRIRFIDEVITVNTKSISHIVMSLFKSILYIRKKRCDLSIDLEFFSKSSTLIQYICGTKIRVGYYLIQIGFLLKMMWRGNLLTNNVYYNQHRHVMEAFLALARSVGADTADMSLPEIHIFQKEIESLYAILCSMGVGACEKIIAVNINASQLCVERRWPIEKFAELVIKIIKFENEKIVI